MAEYRPAHPQQRDFLEQLLEAGLLIASGAPGVYGRSAVFEDVLLAVDERISRTAAGDGAESMRFPPVMPRSQFEASGYLRSFPHLVGTIFGFDGTEEEAREQEARAGAHQAWDDHQRMSDLVLVPAACYPVYPAVAARGRLAPGGITVDAGGSYVFRNEPAGDPARLQMFHQREMVRIGEPERVATWRERWRDLAMDLLHGLGLEPRFDIASDPFFGRSGRMLGASQRQQALKFEILVPIAGPEPTAVASFNYHQTHFADVFGIELADGGTAHTSCLGFGLERIALALFRTHGLDRGTWPDQVRAELWT